MTIRPAPGKPTSNVRLCISNDSGYSIDLHLYAEAVDPKTGIIRFESYVPPNSNNTNWRPGQMHGLPISTPYLTKDYLQAKRFQAQSNGSTYAYDLPDMFRQQIEKAWTKHIEEMSTPGTSLRKIIIFKMDLYKTLFSHREPNNNAKSST